MTEPTEANDGEPADDHLTRVHTEIGNRPGLIVELRPEERDDQPPHSGDMTHLSLQDARELYQELGDALGPNPRGAWIGTASGLSVREPGEDADHPLLELRGDEGTAAVEMPPQFTEGLTHAAAELDMAREDSGDEPEPVTDGGGEIPDGHRITAKTRGEAELNALPDPDDQYPRLDWDYGPSSTQHYQCSCGEPLDDSARSVVDHLIDVGAYGPEPRTDGGKADLDEMAEQLSDAGPAEIRDALADAREHGKDLGKRELAQADPWSDSDVPAHLMDLARHLHAESRDLGDHVQDTKRGDGSELAAAIYQARADALMDASRQIRRTARWLDGERDRPAELEHGAALADSGTGSGVPWRSGGDGGDA